MSRYFNSFMDDYSEALEHSWGTSPKAKAREKEYNHWYYQKHKDEIAALRKQRHAATNSYKQAEKSYDDARRYHKLADKIDYRIKGYRQVGPTYVDPDGNSHTVYKYNNYSGPLHGNAADALNNAKEEYKRKAMASDIKSMELRRQGDKQKYSAEAKSESILQHIKNPTVKDLVEFYLDTTIAKAKKAVKKAKKYVTKVMSYDEKVANKAKIEAERKQRHAAATQLERLRKRKYAVR